LDHQFAVNAIVIEKGGETRLDDPLATRHQAKVPKPNPQGR